MKNKRLSSVGLAIVAMASLLAGCQLYFGDKGNSGGSGGPGAAGGGPGGPSGPGFQCNTDTQCAAGCFCADGTCTEAGFCTTNKDCGDGFVCDTARSSCKPAACPPCPSSSTCDMTTFNCVPACTCASDAEAIKKGFAWCDEPTSTCQQGADPAGACLGAITCTTAQPACPEGQVALRKDGCFTGACRAIAVCEAAPICSALQHEDDCVARTADCTEITNGRDCTHTDGTPCHSGETGCTCKVITFASCEDKGTVTTPMIILD